MKSVPGFIRLRARLRRTRVSGWCLVLLLLSASFWPTLAQTNGVNRSPNVPATNTASTISSVTEDIRDIRGLVLIPSSWRGLLYLMLGLIAVAVGCGLIRWYRRYRQSRLVPKPKLPHELALERLEAARALMTPPQAQAFAFAVSNAVRLYIEDRFQEKAAHRTTEEFLYDLLKQAASPLAPFASPLKDFLQHCDLAKFARWALSSSEMQGMHDSARKFVEETAPREIPGSNLQTPN